MAVNNFTIPGMGQLGQWWHTLNDILATLRRLSKLNTPAVRFQGDDQNYLGAAQSNFIAPGFVARWVDIKVMPFLLDGTTAGADAYIMFGNYANTPINAVPIHLEAGEFRSFPVEAFGLKIWPVGTGTTTHVQYGFWA